MTVAKPELDTTTTLIYRRRGTNEQMSYLGYKYKANLVALSSLGFKYGEGRRCYERV